MRRSFLLLVSTLTATVASGLLAAAPQTPAAQPPSPLGGIWTLNRGASEFPEAFGFNPAWATTPPTDARGGSSGGSGGGGRGRRGSSGGGVGGGGGSASPFSARAESYEDARRVQLVTGEARNPATRLIIVDTPYAVTITNELGQSRTLHTDGKEETVDIEGVPFGVTSRRDGDELVVTYRVGVNREIRYTYSSTPIPKRLLVDVQFLEKGNGDKARRTYDSGTEAVTTSAVTAAPGGGATAPAAPGGAKAPEPFDQRPGAELKGLTAIGVLVEELSATAVSCGLNRDTIEASLAKRLGDGGFTVHRNSDEDTYVYVNIMSSSVATGTCVSRYDAFLYTHATAKLPYRDQPVLVQVSLMHRGGIGTSTPSAHSVAVTRGLEGFVDLFITQIHDANK